MAGANALRDGRRDQILSHPDLPLRLRHAGRGAGAVHRLAGRDPGGGRSPFSSPSRWAAAFARRRDKHLAAREITQLRRMTMEFDERLVATARRMDDITVQMDAAASAQGKKIVAELQVLESPDARIRRQDFPHRPRPAGRDRSRPV